ncbi:MAG TPA: hypothetical protein VFS11_09355 [Gemmatimonadales bacterium]|nr:hypothetical protein [Gemmatimonadales bacterium]
MMPEASAPESVRTWLERHTAHAPAPLRARVMDYASASDGAARDGAASDGAASGAASVGGHVAAPAAASATAGTLARAGAAALARVLAQPGDRSAALDLLAADALVTLALLAQALQAPERLGAFADELLRAGLPAT